MFYCYYGLITSCVDVFLAISLKSRVVGEDRQSVNID